MRYAVAVLAVLLSVTIATAFEIRTPLGIKVRASSETVKQYNAHWATYDEDPELIMFPKRPKMFKRYAEFQTGPKWKDIDWSVPDEWFLLLSKKYGVKPDPKRLTIQIMPLSYNCKDESSFPYSYEFMMPDYGCIDGIYLNPDVIRIHLGDDAGQTWWGQLSKPFCATALDWELFHYFLYYDGNPCWNNESDPDCKIYYEDVSELCDE